MPQFSDDLYLGNAPNLYPTPSTAADPRRPGTGVGPMARQYVYDITPAALAANNLSVSASPGAGAVVLVAGAGVTAVVDYAGVTRYTLDVPRAVRLVSGSDDSGITYTVSGYDFYGQAQTEAITGANAGTATGKKAFSSVTGITHTGSVAGTLTVGTTDVFGLPYAISDAGYIVQAKWNNTLAANAGTFVAADATTPATTTTGDVRGTYLQAGAASDGSKRLVLVLALTAIQVGPNATQLGAFGVVPV